LVPLCGLLLSAAQRALSFVERQSRRYGKPADTYQGTAHPQTAGMDGLGRDRDTWQVTSALTIERVRRDVEVLAHAGLDTSTFLDEVYQSLQRAVPSSAACLAILDPATQLTTGAFKFGGLAGRSDTDAVFGLLEYGHVEPTSYIELARAGIPAIGMTVATGGDVRQSQRVRELVQSRLGCTDELRVIAMTSNQLWGGMAMFRDDHSMPYSEDEVHFVSSLSAFLARGLRVGLLSRLAAERSVSSAANGPAVLVFETDGQLREASVGAMNRLTEVVPDVQAPGSSAVVASLIAAARRYAAGVTDVLPSSRVRGSGGEWAVLHASPLSTAAGTATSIVVTIEEARPPEIVPLVVAAFGLTPRERDVTQLVLQGLETREIATTLRLSPLTVQDHLKSIFSKTGIGSRRELVARVFFDQYVPRIGSMLSPSGGFIDTRLGSRESGLGAASQPR
jgi:DNA-binding CsgD family transcriptional regulator